jgi:amino acid transporter
MILVAWPMSGLFSFFLTLTLSELASAYPVAGAMASWAWKCARGGVGGERKWGWLLGGVVLAGHAAAVRTSMVWKFFADDRWYW